MRVTVFVVALTLLGWGTGLGSQVARDTSLDWDEYTNTGDGFKINFPGQPKVTEGTWTSQLNYMLPMRVYSAEKGREKYSVTVVDYSGIEQLGAERA